MSKRTRQSFTPTFRLESAQLVFEQGESVKDAADAMNVGKSTWISGLVSSVMESHPKPHP